MLVLSIPRTHHVLKVSRKEGTTLRPTLQKILHKSAVRVRGMRARADGPALAARVARGAAAVAVERVLLDEQLASRDSVALADSFAAICAV
ncbi:MAG: hypothetical protein EBT21_07175 [Actinobacteria bacterium]|nr:hypothetical protein [Actinomycetota bacterium]